MKRDLVESQKPPTNYEDFIQLKLISNALDSSDDGFAIWRIVRAQDETVENFELLFMNEAGAKAVGVPRSELIGKLLTEIAGSESNKELSAFFQGALSIGHSMKKIVPVITSQGLPGEFENTVVPFGKEFVLATFRDVSEQQREHEKLIWISEHDFLTGMPNRVKLQEALTERVSMANQKGLLAGFSFIDIDHFKSVNDTYGHDIGDAVLVNFVKRIRNSLPESALVARVSGDEFAIMFRTLTDENQLTDLMAEVFSAMRRPFRFDDKEILITCSAGCVLVDGSIEPDEIMRIADKIMYRAKNDGRNRFVLERITKTI